MTTVHERAVTAVADELSVWPASTTEPRSGHPAVGGVPLAEIADRFGTPVYVLDEGEVRERCRTYRHAFPDAEVLYAAKAFLCRAMVHWMQEEGLGLDVCSAGELELAVTTGFPPERIVLHGNAKSPRDLQSALRLGVGRIVIDSPSEIARLAAAVGPGGHQRVMVRVVPGTARAATRRSVPAPTTRSSACPSPTATPSTPSRGSWTSRSSNSPACTATWGRRSPRSSPIWPPYGAWWA
jgi:diaminopimelate decarboxylase